MKNYLTTLSSSILKFISTIGRYADQKGIKVFLVGGIVRDAILKKRNSDLDVVVEGNAIEFAKFLAKKFQEELRSHPSFGTATLVLQGLRVDFSSTRKEVYPHSGSLPRVQRGSLQDDLSRRDFTINAMAIAMNSDQCGQLIDPFEGFKDLKKGHIRVLHEKSFVDDPTRILRAIRFEQRFHFQIEAKTFRLLKKALSTHAIFNVHPHRYFNEVRKIFKEPIPVQCFSRLKEWNGLKLIYPRLNVDFRSMNSLKGDTNSKFYLLALFENVSSRNLPTLLKTFPFLKEEREILLQNRKRGETIRKLSKKFLKPSDVYQILKPFHEAVIMHWRLKISHSFILSRIDRFLKKDRFVTLQLRGEDLEKAGFHSGEKMGEALKRILYQKIDQGLKTKQDELNFTKSLL